MAKQIEPEWSWAVTKYGASVTVDGSTFELEAEDLRDGGWLLKTEVTEDCIEGECMGKVSHEALVERVDSLVEKVQDYEAGDEYTDDLARAMTDQHDRAGHFGALRFCSESPCREWGKFVSIRFD